MKNITQYIFWQSCFVVVVYRWRSDAQIVFFKNLKEWWKFVGFSLIFIENNSNSNNFFQISLKCSCFIDNLLNVKQNLNFSLKDIKFSIYQVGSATNIFHWHLRINVRRVAEIDNINNLPSINLVCSHKISGIKI